MAEPVDNLQSSQEIETRELSGTQRAGEGNLLRVEEYLAREKDRGVALSEEE